MKKSDVLKGCVLSLCTMITILLVFTSIALCQTMMSETGNAKNGYTSACIDSERVFAVRDDGKGVDVISVLTGLVTDSMLLDNDVHLCATDGRRGLLYAADTRGMITVMLTESFDRLSSFQIGRKPSIMAVDSNRNVMITADDRGVITFVDLTAMKVMKQIQSFEKPSSIAVDTGLGLAIIVHGTWGVQEDGKRKDSESRDNVTLVDLQSLSIRTTMQAGKNPLSVAVNPFTHEAVVANEKSDDITVVDLNSLMKRESLSVEKHPLSLSYNECLNSLSIIGGEDKGWMWGVDMDTLEKETAQAIPDKPEGIVIHSPFNRAFITGRDGVSLINLPNPVPDMLILTPEHVMRGETAATLMIEGKGLLQNTEIRLDGKTVVSTFIECGKLRVSVPGSLLQGACRIEVKADNPAPAGGTSTAYHLTVENPVPSITAIDPAEANVGTSEMAITLFGTGFFEDTEVLLGGTKIASTYGEGKIQIHLTAADLISPGTYEITAVNQPPGGGASNSVLFVVKGESFDVTIMSPVANQAISQGRTIVQGTLDSASADIGIQVNGITADIKGNTWVVSDVPLVPGENTITVTASDLQGNTETKTVTVFAENTTRYVALSANIRNGVAPLTTSFNVMTETESPIAGYAIDFEGDGVVDFTGADFSDIQFTYPSEGIYYPAIHVTDNKGYTYTDTISITVFSKQEIDGILKKRWEDMKVALFNKDVEGAVQCFLEHARERYGQILTLLIDDLPRIVSDMKDIEMIYLENGIAKYRIRRDHVIGGRTVQITYYIYFGRGADGIWRIDKF